MALSTRERLMSAADDLFYRDGFHAVGLDSILTKAGVTKTTFYNHFESKDELILDVLRMHDRWWRDTFTRILRENGGDEPRGQLLALPAILEHFSRSEVFNGCIFINASVEFPVPHDPVHVAAAEHKEQMEMILRDLALRAGASDPIALSEELCIILEGAYVTQQVTLRPHTIDIVRRLVTTTVEKYIPLAEPLTTP